MIGLWLLYATTIGLAMGVAASLLERALRWSGRPARFLWAAAMLMSWALPLYGALRSGAATPTDALVEQQRGALFTYFSLLDRPLLCASAVLTLAVFLALVRAQSAVLRDRGSWREQKIDGIAVLVSQRLGPGVWFLGRARIVVPAWCLALDERVRSLLVAHEHEHVRARDHWLLLFGLLGLTVFPLNAGLWWQFRRLKLAIEMDCDARVLSGRQDVRRYATLLLDVGQRCRTGHLAFAAFAAPRHAIERRIRMMLDPKPRSHRLLAGACAVGAVVIGVLACNTPEPAAPDGALRNALGLTAPPTENHPNAKEGAEQYEVRFDQAERQKLPPPPPPPPKPELVDEVVRVKEAMKNQ